MRMPWVQQEVGGHTRTCESGSAWPCTQGQREKLNHTARREMLPSFLPPLLTSHPALAEDP